MMSEMANVSSSTPSLAELTADRQSLTLAAHATAPLSTAKTRGDLTSRLPTLMKNGCNSRIWYATCRRLR